jgi:hypothetical protein
MMQLSTTWPFLHSVPEVLRPFVKGGKVDAIFRPRVLANGIFATQTGYGVSFSIGGVDSEGLDRRTLDHVSKQIAAANRMLPQECMVFEYLITAHNDELPARPITQEVARQQAQERTAFLKANARFKSVRLIMTLYIPGKVSEEAEEFAEKSRSSLRPRPAADAGRIGPDLQLPAESGPFTDDAQGGKAWASDKETGPSPHRPRR